MSGPCDTQQREQKEDPKDGNASSGCAWEDNIKIELKEMAWEVADQIHLAHNRDQWWAFVNKLMNLQVS